MNTDQTKEELWKCCGCGAAYPTRRRICDCATGVLYRRDGNGFIVHEVKIEPDVMDWHPIETAPNGPDDFFLVCGDDRSPFVVRGDIMWGARKPNTPEHLSLHYLTHWMPLPSKPSAYDQNPGGQHQP